MRVSSSPGKTIVETLPVATSVNWRNSPLFRSSVQMLKMSPLAARFGSTGASGSVVVDEKTRVWSSRNWAAASLKVPKVSWVFSFVARSSVNSLLLPLTRARYTREDPSGENVGA